MVKCGQRLQMVQVNPLGKWSHSTQFYMQLWTV
uniref:Uncharacterized protein n=1 Tax=Anguilla anguilla TaxID=7936 RepID=A0A0E9R045_ANGAN